MIVSFISLIFMVNLSSKDSLSDKNILHQKFYYLFDILANLISAILFAAINIILRYLKDVNHVALSCLNSIFYFLASPLILLLYRTFINPNQYHYNFTLLEVLLLIGNGVFITGGNLFYYQSFKYDKAGRTSSLWFLAIVVGYIFDIIFFNY